MNTNLAEILNTIRDNASDQYQERIPEATRNNIESIQEVMSDPSQAVVQNEFVNALLNMIIKQVIINKLFSDPLKSLKKGNKPLGDTIEEIYVNFLKGETYDPTGANLLTRKLPDVKAVYHRMNRQDKYKVTIGEEQLRKAFASYDKLGAFIQSIIKSLYNSSERDEFILIKQLIKQALDNNAMVVVNVADPLLSEDNAKAFVKAVKTISGGMEFPSEEYNAYLTAQSTDIVPITTFSKKNEQILIIDNATNVSNQIDVLATTFNMSVAEFNDTRKIVIDSFPDPDVRAVLVDEQFFQVFDDLVAFREFNNGEGLYTNYNLHIWQTLAYSILVNAVAFKVASDEDDDGQIDEYSITATLKTGVSLANKNTSVAEGSSYISKVKGIKSTDTIVITMGTETIEGVETPVDITSTAWDSETNTITIDKVTADVTISVS